MAAPRPHLSVLANRRRLLPWTGEGQPASHQSSCSPPPGSPVNFPHGRSLKPGPHRCGLASACPGPAWSDAEASPEERTSPCHATRERPLFSSYQPLQMFQAQGGTFACRAPSLGRPAGISTGRRAAPENDNGIFACRAERPVWRRIPTSPPRRVGLMGTERSGVRPFRTPLNGYVPVRSLAPTSR